MFTYYVYEILVLLFQLMLQENIVKEVSRYTVGSVNVYTIWRLFVFRYTVGPRLTLLSFVIILKTYHVKYIFTKLANISSIHMNSDKFNS